MRFSVVDFPQPSNRPTRETNSPSATSRDTLAARPATPPRYTLPHALQAHACHGALNSLHGAGGEAGHECDAGRGW